jgi:hypothetical protein
VADKKKDVTDRDLISTVHLVMRARTRPAPPCGAQPEAAASAAD